MIDKINKHWGWIGFNATEIIRLNDFGNIIFKTELGNYWRICPEELYCIIIAKTTSELDTLFQDSEFIEDWDMENLIEIAEKKLGSLESNQKYYLVMPAIIGGAYSKENIQKISFSELISLSASLAYQMKDIKDGTKIKLTSSNKIVTIL